VKGDLEGQWLLRTPRNDELCCSYEDHVLLANLGNIDWRPCLNLWAVMQYISKYATKAPKGSRRMFEVLSDAVDDVCRFVPQEQDMLRRSIQRFFARTLGERDYHVYEAMHVGLGLPLVVPLLPVVSLNSSGARAMKQGPALAHATSDALVHYDSKIDKFDQRRSIFMDQFKTNPQQLEKVLEEVAHVSLYEFYWKYVSYRGKFLAANNSCALMVTPCYSADCANVQHSAHAAYAKTCVIAYWRLMPTQMRHALYRNVHVEPLLGPAVGDWVLGGTDLKDQRCFLGVHDLYQQFEGRSHGRKHVDGWVLGLLEMLTDPVLVSWVPKWVREQYQRANPYFRRVLERMSGSVFKCNRRFLLVLFAKMVSVHEKAVVRKSRLKEEQADDGSSSELAEADRGAGLTSDEDDRPVDPVRDNDDDDEDVVRVPIVHEPRPDAGGDVVQGIEEKDWAQAGLAERLSAAGPAPAAATRVLGAVSGGPSNAFGQGRMLYNPREYPYEANSVVDRSQFKRLEQLMNRWQGQAVGDGADSVGRHELDPWQCFAHDIVARRDRETSSDRVRCFMIGSAGTGKSRTVRSFVGVRRNFVKRQKQLEYSFAELKNPKVINLIKEHMRYCCQLGAPTGCASFQLRFGASTLHRLFGVPIGFCGPSNRYTKKYREKTEKIKLCSLYVLDEVSMIGRRMLGKIEFKLRDHLGNATVSDGIGVDHPVMGDKDYVLCGDPKQITPIGDEPIYQDGEYTGTAENKPLSAQTVPQGALSAKSLVRMGLNIRDRCQDVVILRKVHRIQNFDPSLSAEKRELYAQEAVTFLHVTRAMADCTWTRDEHKWLCSRNRSVLQQTPEGRDQLKKLEKTPLLMDSKVDKVSGQVGADRLNELRLQELSARTNKPVIALGAYHGQPENQPELRANLLDAEDFRGMKDKLVMCEGARVLLTDNIWIEAGLMNGAIGTLKGFMWPAGGDPNSTDSTKRCPLCLIVDFDNVNLKDENSQPRTFFPGEPDKARWVPVFRKTVNSSQDEGVSRSQYPLVLAWALTHWKAQGMTLHGARVHLSEKTAAVAGLPFVASTRVRHPWDLVYEEDLPDYEHFMKARGTPAFRRRRRWELRLQELASITLRKYRYCSDDFWTEEEANAAASLIEVLKRFAAQQRETMRSQAGCVVDSDTWLWGEHEPDYDVLLSTAVSELQSADATEGSRALYERVVSRLLDRMRRRFLTSAEQNDADQLIQRRDITGLPLDSEALIGGLAAVGSTEFSRYLAVAKLVSRRLGQVEVWDNMIEEDVPAELGWC